MKIRHMSKKIDIISLYLDDYNKLVSGREIARLSGMNHQSCLNHLNELVKLNIMSCRIKGRNKEYYLNLEDHLTVEMVKISEHYRALLRLRGEVGVIIKDLMQFAEVIILFGSYADFREKSDSDIDLVVSGDKKNIEKVAQKYSKVINVEYVTFSQFSKSLKEKKPLALEILKKHILFGNADAIVEEFVRFYRR